MESRPVGVHEEHPTTASPAALRSGPREGDEKTEVSMAPARRSRGTEKQVLFRIEADLLSQLDRRLQSSPYRTRNAWFKAVLEDYLARSR